MANLPVIHLDDQAGGGASFGWDGQVEFRANLPITIGTPPVGSIYLVEKKTTILGFTTYQSGLYFRDFNNGNLNDWRRMNVKVQFTDAEFVVVSASDTSKQAKLDITALATSSTVTMAVQNASGTIAYLSNIPGPQSWSSVLTQGNTSGANDAELDLGQAVRFQNNNHGAILSSKDNLMRIFAQFGTFFMTNNEVGGSFAIGANGTAGQITLEADASINAGELITYFNSKTSIADIDTAGAKVIISKEWVEELRSQYTEIFFPLINTTTTVINAANTPVKIAGNTTLGINGGGFSMPIANRVQWNDTLARTLLALVTITITGNKQQAGGDENFTAYINDTGAIQLKSKQGSRMDNADQHHIQLQSIIQFTNGRWVEAWIENNGDADDININHMHISVTPIKFI